MNTQSLQYLLDHAPWLSHYRGQVCALDLLPQQKSSDTRMFIVNTDPSDRPGEHWVAVFFHDNKEAYYFDSYGLPPWNNEILDFLEKNSSRWTFNDHQIQSFYSRLCGQYCIFTLDALAKGYDIGSYLQEQQLDNTYVNKDNRLADGQFLKNDYHIEKWFKQNYETIYHQPIGHYRTKHCQICKVKDYIYETRKPKVNGKIINNYC